MEALPRLSCRAERQLVEEDLIGQRESCGYPDTTDFATAAAMNPNQSGLSADAPAMLMFDANKKILRLLRRA